MNKPEMPASYGVLTDSNTLTIQRLLPGPIERIWAYLTEEDLRRQWLAAGEMAMAVGASFEFVWHNDQLTQPSGHRPPGFSEEHRLQSEITELDPPRRLAISWGSTGGVSFDLEPRGQDVLLTVTHHRVPDPSTLLNVSTGWHTHLDLLAARLTGIEPTPFWEGFLRNRAEYERRLSV
ncbi:SRPBCC family protein [Marinobacter sp. R17]|uniref:SRPBCC family protein n=1 Tax=Marinobacter sp. R17 TaxID=2484250 RepID=UPI000F4BA6E1|nr:SRPBCC family protein [Marinobacter sp. R17]ROT95783.1 SRPBCC family protein [Marinobacter sp. R17]